MFCVQCNRPLIGRQRKFCSRACQNLESNGRNQAYPKQQLRARLRKVAAILALGGECSECGYNANLMALVFHHRNPAEKVFEINAHYLANRSQASIDAEVAKCDLLCSNCHLEHHNPEGFDWQRYADGWLGDKDSNPDSRVQSPLSYH